ncbi:probable disease resistance protein At5g66900 isoform X1 [Vitis vinifera]|uniref:probable disease resistance protein At5g66900 isoform X1 n=1 Tax=Vitis vinifera TaxID=29760 RepID=UPI0008FED05E|nr:probable disease resistance protein At5g66900 isoform X1 [Vitis vinifera]|eukprot:XP_019074085.1 PREDICTED: probable disease resistance protein At5g66900 isoform X1 [Vitis vinifera]
MGLMPLPTFKNSPPGVCLILWSRASKHKTPSDFGGCGEEISMALALVGGAALGAAFQGLLTAVIKVSKKFAGFHSILKKLEATLERIKPYIQEMERLNDELDRPRKEMEKFIQILQDGEKLIQDCSSCYYHQRIGYANKIKALDASLLRLFQVDVHAQVSRDVKEILAILKSNGCNWNYRGVSDEHENLGSCNAPGPPEFMVGLDVPLKELKRWLCEDGESRIVIKALGGCGKTTLAKELCHDNQVREYFKHILYATVSRSPNLIAIITKLFWDEDERVPKFQNEEDAANQMELKLKKKEESGDVLLVLDDVWRGSESLLAKFKFRTSKSKVVVTSRNDFPEFGSTYDLKSLNDDDAMALFRHSAIPQNGSCYFTPSNDLVKKIVGHCKGLPLALEVVGRSLHGRPVEIWRSRLKKLSEGQSVVDSEADLRKCLQSSIDALNDEDVMLKECFMDLGSFPEDQKIPATALIDMWAELYNLDKDGIDAIANLHELSSRSLLNLAVTRNDASEIDGWYSDAIVMQHDDLRDLAIYQSKQELIKERKRLFVDFSKLPEWWTEEEQPQSSARLVSISTGEMFSSSQGDLQIPETEVRWCNMQIPDPEVLILNFNQTQKKYKLPEFIKQMDKLKVLIVTNYGIAVELTNFSVLGSLSNLKRIRLEKVSIPTLCNTSMGLKNLEKISLVMCYKIGQAFASSTIQITEMLANLREINIDYCNDLVELPEGFCDLVRLNKLSISNCPKLSALPEGIGKLANLEVLRLRACARVSKLPDSIGSLHKLSFLDITGCVRLSEMPNRIGGLRDLREFHMRRCPGLCELPSSVKDLVDLESVICDESTVLLWESFKHFLPNLTLSVREESINWHLL